MKKLFGLAATVLLLAVTPSAAVAASTPNPDDNAAWSSLTAAMISVHAKSSQNTLDTYLQKSGLTLSSPQTTVDPSAPTDTLPATISSPTVLSPTQASNLGLSGKSLTATSFDELSKKLEQSGAGLNRSDTANLDALARAVQTKAVDWDSMVTRAGAVWVGQLGKMHTAALVSPNVPAPTVPKNALPFGLLLDRTLEQNVKNSSSTLGAAQSSGLGTGTTPAAWNAAMGQAWAQSSKDLLASVPDPCTGTMLTTMATGTESAGSSGCSPGCVTGGKYLHQQMSTLFTSGRTSALNNPTSDVWNAKSVNNLPGWVSETITGSNPGLSTLDTSGSDPCTTASNAATTTASRALPEVFSSLLGN